MHHGGELARNIGTTDNILKSSHATTWLIKLSFEQWASMETYGQVVTEKKSIWLRIIGAALVQY